MNGSEYIVEFLNQRQSKKVFLITGGACAFIIDALGSHQNMEYVCFQHEQAAAMAADAVWRVDGTVGVTLATSGPGATNLLTGIACSYFDSIPSIHITGQVNKSESAAFLGANVRQAGFQETNIVDMAKPITKYAVQVNTINELKLELVKAYNLAITGRMGPVLIDVPMNVQQEEAGDTIEYDESTTSTSPEIAVNLKNELKSFFEQGQRPLVLFGAGVGLAGVEDEVTHWLESQNIPFVSSWNAMTYFNHDSPVYFGQIGVYGNRGANFILQNCDTLLVLGSRLDNRQRSGNSSSFAPKAKIHVVDVDSEELKKYAHDGYAVTQLNLCNLAPILTEVMPPLQNAEWRGYLKEMKEKYFGKDLSTFAKTHGSISPYQVTQKINSMIQSDAIVIPECGANLCWVYQIFHRTYQTLFTAGGMSPMGYAVPASIGAALTSPEKQVICLVGDGGYQMNIQELQTIKHYDLDIKIVIFNNYGYGIIKQFQDSYFESRYEATNKGYSLPDFKGIVEAYGLKYKRIDHLEELVPELFDTPGTMVMDITLDPNTLIEPKLEMGRPIHDQFPYVSDQEFAQGNRFVSYKRMK